MMDRKYTVYKHTTPSGKVYIGMTSQETKRRWQNGKNYKSNRRFCDAISKYGWENIRHEILYTDLSKEQAEEKEIELIRAHKSTLPECGYNIEYGGNKSGKTNEETRKRMSEAKKGMHYKKRRNHTEEEKRAISNKLKGRISPMKGRHWTIEQRARVGTPILCKTNGKMYYSIREAERDTGANRANINRVLKGIYKQTRGYVFEYVHEGL